MACEPRTFDLSLDPLSLVDHDKMQLQNTKNASASRLSLFDLPGEVFSGILQAAMQSEEPVYIWLFPGIKYTDSWGGKEEISRLPLRYPSISVFEKQEEHFSDWKCVTSTCRGFRDHGIPAFFREKRFLIPTRLFRVLSHTDFWDMGKEVMLRKDNQGRYFNVLECIQHIVVPNIVGPWFDLCYLPRHKLESLASVTIWVADHFTEDTKLEIRKSLKTHGDILKGIDVRAEGVAIPYRTLGYFPYTTIEATLVTRLSQREDSVYHNVQMCHHYKEGINRRAVF